MKTIIVVLTILTAGCANLAEMTEAERAAYLVKQEERQYDRQEALIEAKLAYEERAVACGRAGGVMMIQRQNATRFPNRVKENRWEYRLAQCTKW